MYTFDLEFHDSILEQVVVKDRAIELKFQEAILLITDSKGVWLKNEFHRIPASIIIKEASSGALPSPGWLYHGWLVNMATNEEFVGTLPIDLSITSSIELTIEDESGEKKILGSGIEVRVNREDLPRQFT